MLRLEDNELSELNFPCVSVRVEVSPTEVRVRFRVQVRVGFYTVKNNGT